MKPLTREEIDQLLEMNREWCRKQFWERIERQYIQVEWEASELVEGA